MNPHALVAVAGPLLQIPGGGEVAVLGVVNLVLAAVVGYFVYRDAQGRDTGSPALWAVGMALASLLLSFLGFLVAFAVYWFVVVRD